MNRINTLAFRIVAQLRHDKRTMALILFAPIIVLVMIYSILGNDDVTYKIGIISAPESYVTQLTENEDISVESIDFSEADRENAIDAIKAEEIAAAVYVSDDLASIDVYLDGTNTTTAKQVIAVIKSSLNLTLRANSPIALSEAAVATNYIYGSENTSNFDNFGTPMIGIIIFFFVFLIGGINFLGERSSGTLEKMLSTPIRRGEIVVGYVIGFSILALLQTVILTLFVVYVLNVTVVGSIWYVLLINLLTALMALTLGMSISCLASSEFQMVQFIPIVIIPQIFLCGLFDLTSGWEVFSKFMPLTYSVDALREVMLHGNGIETIWLDLLAILGFSAIFMLLNISFLRRQRSI
ncbi:ABC transporter permease [Konateibacter massiliensis]|uniref:ABC transporter permease n=1 Tax=Konateibacter massiliensis TaxID=2002841 RepID=UPI000C150E28|nr:ABC transporter permease [Konateibacter massiliensis]